MSNIWYVITGLKQAFLMMVTMEVCYLLISFYIIKGKVTFKWTWLEIDCPYFWCLWFESFLIQSKSLWWNQGLYLTGHSGTFAFFDQQGLLPENLRSFFCYYYSSKLQDCSDVVHCRHTSSWNSDSFRSDDKYRSAWINSSTLFSFILELNKET